MIVDVTRPLTSDLDLIKKAVDGSHDAFAQLIRRYDDRMRAVAYQMTGDSHAMDDVLQVSYLKAYKSLSTFRSEASFSSWLHRIVVNTCHDLQRKKKRRPEVSLEVIADQPSTRSSEDEFATSSTLHTSLQKLSPDMRAVVILVDGQGLTYDEAATVLETEPGTIASRLNRARSALRQHLGLPKERVQ